MEFKGKPRKAVPSIILILAIVLSPLLVLAGTKANKPLGLSKTKLGQSTVYSVRSAEELQEIVALGKSDYSGMVLQVENDFSVGDLPKWEAIGTEKAPFNGTVEGGEHTISGVGSSSQTTLFGYLKGATIKNLNITTTLPSSSDNPYYGLLQHAENSTIINCHISYLSELSTMSLMGLRGGRIVADPNWINDNVSGGASTTPKVTNASQLWAFAEAVTSGTKTFLNTEVEIVGTIDCQNQPFSGIGTGENAFKGSLSGSNCVIKNLKLSGVNGEGTGFIAYADSGTSGFTTIENIRLENVSVAGRNNTGALLGYGKDVVVKDCSVSGSVTGGNEVGGLVGNLNITLPFENDNGSGVALPYIENCYSTANVSGGVTVGGIVGAVNNNGTTSSSGSDEVVVNNCFTTGVVNGNSQVGGIAGSVAGKATFSLCVGNCASLSVVSGNVNVGGIIGMAGTVFNDPSGAPPVVDSYFAGTVKGVDRVGGLVGNQGGAKSSYVSGDVVSPLVFSVKTHPSIMPAVGHAFYTYQPDVFVVPNTIHRPGDPTNSKISDADANRYIERYDEKSGAFGGGTKQEPILGSDIAAYQYKYFKNGSVSDPGAAFTVGNLNITADGITGTFPKLDSFSDSGLSSVFDVFSKISTNASIASFPSELYVNNSGKLSVSENGAAFVLPSVSGMEWKINGAKSTSINDITIKNNTNTITMNSDGTIGADAPLNSKASVIITGESKSSGIKLNFSVDLADQAVRAIAEETPAEFILDKTKSSPGLLLEANIMSIALTEGVSTSTAIPNGLDIALTEYSGKDFNGTATVHPAGATIVPLSDSALKITIDKMLLSSDKSYMLDLASGSDTFKDGSGNTLDSKYYFRTISNSKPIISFDTTYNLYQKNEFGVNSTSANKDAQTVGMVENDGDYYDYLEGVTVDNPNGRVIDLTDPAFGGTFTMNVVQTLAGKHGYEQLATEPLSNFMKVPGEYQIKYQVPDPEDNSLKSNIATRTYRVYSRTYFTRGQSDYSTFTATFTADDMVAIHKEVERDKISVAKAVENALKARYTTNSNSSDYLSAFRYSYDGTKENIAVEFDTSALTNDVFEKGFKQIMTVKAGSAEQSFLLDINSTMSDYEIEVDNDTFTCVNNFYSSKAKEHFNAKVRQKSTGEIVNRTVKYNFKDILPYDYNIPQEVTITMVEPSGVTEINGIDLTVSKTVTVVIQKEIKYKHPEDIEETPRAFWEETSDTVKTSSAKRTITRELSYEESNETPADFFRIVANRKGEPVKLTLPSGITLSFKSQSIDKAKTPYNKTRYNLAIEPMYDVYISRDTKGKPVQQFVAAGKETLPGTLEVSMPLDKGMPTEDLKLYTIDEDTNKYVLLKTLDKKDVKENVVTLELKELGGRYILTEANLQGKTAGKNK